MATLTTGTTWVNAETITSTKLNNTVNAATITDIVNADIKSDAAIVDTKLAQIATASKVSGAALTGLASIPAGAGAIPAANLTAVASKALDNLASVAINTSLISDTDNTDDLGSDAKKWKDLYTKDIKGLNGSMNPTNLLSNGNFESWSAGASAAPDGWTLYGGNVARESSEVESGTYSAKFARSGSDCGISQAIHAKKGINYYKGKTITVAVRMKSAQSNGAMYVSDGVGATVLSTYTGGSGWQTITATRTIDASATGVTVYVQSGTADGDYYIDSVQINEGSSAFAFSPKPAEEGVWADYSAVSTIVGWSSFTIKKIYTKKIGRTVFVAFAISGTSNATNVTFTLPYTSSSVTDLQQANAMASAKNNGSFLTAAAPCTILSSTSTATCYPSYPTGSWTDSGAKEVFGTLIYESE